MKNSFNLLKPQRAPETFWEKFYVWAMSISRYIVVFVELFVILAFFYRFRLDRNLNDTRERVQIKVDKLALYKDEEMKLLDLEDKLSTYSTLKENRGSTNEFFTELLGFLPAEINDLEIYYSNGKITVGGQVDEEKLTKLEDRFKSSENFKDVILKTREKSEDNEKELTFEFEAVPIRKFNYKANNDEAGQE